MAKGYFSLVLHAHLPYVFHKDRDDYLEERWLYEAITETYLPLLDVFERLSSEQIHFRVTLTMTPTLCNLLENPILQDRYIQFLHRLIRLSENEIERTQEEPEFHQLAILYHQRFHALLNQYASYNRDLIGAFRRLQDLGYLEIVTCAATHGFLPLMMTEESIRAQIATGVEEYKRHFGRAPRGIWLPECGYSIGVDRILREFGIHYFFTDTHTVLHASPRANRGVFAPIMSPYGLSAFARDPESSKQVWSSLEGYPGDYDYREYYRDIGWDLGWNSKDGWDYIRPYVLSNGDRIHTGIKYYRITGDTQDKCPYNPEWAQNKAAEHAGNFMFNRELQVKHCAKWMDRKPIVVSTYDAELFGHWWYEGPVWIEMLARKIFWDQDTIQMITPSEYLEEYPLADTGKLPSSSWGRNGYAEVWLNDSNQWMYRHLHQAETKMVKAASLNFTHPLCERLLNQATRELMLAQSSDWAFIMDSKTVVDYAVKRAKLHLNHFHQLVDLANEIRVVPEEPSRRDHKKLVAECVELLEQLEAVSPCFPNVDFRWYQSHLAETDQIEVIPSSSGRRKKRRKRILMLSWEYPPKVVGGLSRAVADLSKELASFGHEVYVLTSVNPGSPSFEVMDDVRVYRVPVLQSTDHMEFINWVLQMNTAIVDQALFLASQGVTWDVIHAHDWLVSEAARELKHSLQLPLVATIHATEHGRNHGRLHTELQSKIHGLEWELTYEAKRVIACSSYMQAEVQHVFSLPGDKLSIRPNGVAKPVDLHPFEGEERRRYLMDDEQMIFYVGRLVYEKGVQTLIHAMPHILDKCPQAKLVIAGRGPMLQELQDLASTLGHKVMFLGFVEDDLRDRLFRTAAVSVFPSHYEPFGIVALEAMRCMSPLVVSDTGGLSEIIEHGVDGYKALPGHVESLAWHVSELLIHPDLGQSMALRALQKVSTLYNWNQIAEDTVLTYEEAMSVV